MRFAVSLIIVALIICAVLANNARKPFELRIDAQGPGVWPEYAAANRVEMVERHTGMRLMTPYRVTSEPRKGVTLT